MRHIQVLQLCREKFRYYVVFTPSIFFILGLIFSYKLVEKTFLNILITRLIEAWGEEEYDLRKGVVVVNLQEGTSAVLVVLFCYVADVYTGYFQMVVISTAVSIIGLLLNYLAAGNDDSGQLKLRLFYPALGLMALAQAAQTATLQAFLDDQLRPMDLDEDLRQRRSEFWWILVSFVAAIFAQFGPLPGFHFKKLAIVLIGVVGGCVLVFMLGTKYYYMVPTIPNPFKEVENVIARAIANRNLEYTLTTEPHVPWLRWLDKAAEAGSWNSVEQVRSVKLLLKMLPLWSCFLSVSLVAALEDTFFYEEAIYIYDEDDIRPIIFFANLVRFTEFVVSQTSSYVVRKLKERKKFSQQKMELTRIGIGLSCCVLCCIVAWATETRRKQWAAENERGNKLIVYWLVPQYFLLGLIWGFARDGLYSFYQSQVSESLSRFGPPFVDFVMGVGRFMSLLCVLIFSRKPFKWFQIDIDSSRLDKYYILLAVLSFVNAVIYCLVAWWYGDDAFLLDDEENVSLPQQVGTAPRSIEGQKEQSSCADKISESSKINEVEVENDEAKGIASSIEGQRISRRTVSKPRESSSGDVITESSSSRQEEEEEDEDVLRRAVKKFKRLISRAARRRSSDSTLSKNQ
ncbi:protein NRT1/ PTR FAMILY 5.11-like [Salvia miltiorrhiza]|uniref:protein NRT1/ PTR FAMILY 5.11-like n=1 Tax=Salvia miltiorrhiza TaxID=226208 RepID=UPI0025AD5FCD|nr:protein NRT1/ PTR FAMILY 5.11-like [Salvia miltiorrhiza]